ncbi:hypothetical protein ACJ6WF_48465 [Streptomyces sp. MMS24-I2-30]|uniref:hypothetical protein n=1 Tax=Streptomyces sp. MMS24-I2-30 TaxID=3351564 RepID=UPI003896ABCF
MIAPALYEIETSEGDDGTCVDGAADDGFIAHQGLFVAALVTAASIPNPDEGALATWAA